MADTSHGASRSSRSKQLWASGERRAESLTNAIYGTIIMAAFFAVIEDRVDSAAELLAELIFATLVLFLAHLFASWIGSEATSEENLSRVEVLEIVRAQLPLALVVAVPALLLAAASLGAFSVEVAVGGSLAYSIVFLFGVSCALGLHHGRGAARSALYGLVGAGLGAAVIGLEAALH